MLEKGGKDEDFGSDEDNDYISQMNSNEDISQRSLKSNTVSPKEQFKSSLTSPGANLDQELEKLLLEEAKRQGIFDVDAVKT